MPGNDDRAARLLTRRFLEGHPGEAAEVLDLLPVHEQASLIEEQPVARAAAIVRRLRPDATADLLEALSDDFTGKLLPSLEPARAAASLARLAPEARDRRLALADPDTARELSTLMTYRPDSAGGSMDPRVATFHPEARVRDALKRLRTLRHKRVSDVFLVDADGRLAGSVALQDLAVAEAATALGDLVRAPAVSVRATASHEEVLEVFEQSRVPSVPVVDFEGRVIGVIRHAGLVNAAQATATADMQAMVGVSREERALSSVGLSVRRRLPWLQINLLTAFVAASVVGLFEDTIAQFTALAVLLPVVAGQSGNTGAQALAVTMRGLALREIRPRHWLRVSTKEVFTGFFNGIAVSLVTGLAVLIWSRSLGLAIVIAIAMVISMAIAALSGASIPIVLTKLGQDPAQASSIILTTVTDVVGFLSFLGLATLAIGFL
jgi:magnesium transporter